MEGVKLLTIFEVAELVRKTPGQLRWLRHQGKGPTSAKLGGRIVYREQDVLDWVNTAFSEQVPA
ncbi:helix-turn-helix transcriptional regulator [Paenarthrobacter sp. YIM B13468]|uniref:helix-turn-helix transcriptional regulator n=1 Tax=Paenarthrobacter sp. YIM B13468 TaxID=3366295 RepID=UPI003672AD4A